MLADAMFADAFATRVLRYDGGAARRYSKIVMSHRASGELINACALIAVTERIAGAAVAMLDIGGFSRCGLALIAP